MKDSPLVTAASSPASTAPFASGVVFSVGAEPAPITSGDIRVAGQRFSGWFNSAVQGHAGFLNHLPDDDAPFRAAFDNVTSLWSPSITLEQFVAFFCIFYNETGGTLKPVAEIGGPRYCFEAKLPGGGTKRSYNHAPNRLAGDQLAQLGVISKQEDVDVWNGDIWPASASDEVQKAAKQCDFYKYRGRGLIQTTWRSNYLTQVNPLLAQAGVASCDDLTTEELDAAILERPTVYLGMVQAFFRLPKMTDALAKVDQSPPLWAPTGTLLSGSSTYGSGVYTRRCQALYGAMMAAGYKIG